MSNTKSNTLRLKRLGIDTHGETVLFMRDDCHVCLSEGLAQHTRVQVDIGQTSLVATVNHVSGNILLQRGEAGLSEHAWRQHGWMGDELIRVSHLDALNSLSQVRGKIFGKRLTQPQLSNIISDIAAKKYSNIHLAAFLTACAARGLEISETVDLTQSMVDVGQRIDWGNTKIVDKHCVGGLPGNRTTPIVVAIVAACGFTMPKTSSRAITSPAGTADMMETLAPVDLDIATMRRVVEKENGCIVWGGSVDLSPADDILIAVERALEIDSEGQLVASILSKKIAAGSTHLVLDLPVGATAKIRSLKDAEFLGKMLRDVANAFDIKTAIIQSDGSQPVGRGIGPALEARDVLSVLNNAVDAPQDLKQRAVTLAGALIDLAEKSKSGGGNQLALETLENGKAWNKFQRICDAQGGMRQPPSAAYHQSLKAAHNGVVHSIDNRRLAKLAKLAGAPDVPAAGVDFHVRLGEVLQNGQDLLTVHAQTKAALEYAFDYVSARKVIVEIGEPK